MIRTLKASLMALAAVIGLSSPAMAQDAALSNLPMSISTATEETFEPTQAAQRRASSKTAPAASSAGKKLHAMSGKLTMENWQAELDVSGISDVHVIHAATIFSGHYTHNFARNMFWGAHLGLGWENVSVGEPQDGGFMFELGAKYRWNIDRRWDIGGDILYRTGSYSGDFVDYSYTNMRITFEGGLQVTSAVRSFAKIRFNSGYNGDIDFPVGSTSADMDSVLGFSLGGEYQADKLSVSLELRADLQERRRRRAGRAGRRDRGRRRRRRVRRQRRRHRSRLRGQGRRVGRTSSPTTGPLGTGKPPDGAG